MDPNANLQEQLDIAAAILESVDAEEGIDVDDAARLAELVEALHGWISGGGFLPSAWRK